MSTGFGVVRAVNSGDSISIWENSRAGGPPPVRDIYLTNVQAPKLGYNNAEDAPFAWQSREFLRELCIGKKVKFTVEHKTANGREYGNVETDTGLNLAIAISEAGWAEIRSPPDGKDPRTEEHKTMLENQTRAQEQKIGIFQEDQTAGATPKAQKLNTMKFFDKYKEKSIVGIVEYVRDAGCVNVLLKDCFQKITLRLAGISAPRVPSKARQEEGEKPEPFGLESRFFVERHLLNRTVDVTITAPGEANRKGEFYGSIELAGHTLASQLLRNGYAKLVEWSAPPKELDDLKKCQQEAMTKKTRIWTYVSAVENAKEPRKEWNGKVREVRDGSSLIIEDLVTGEKKFVLLSNVKVPRLGKSPEPFAYEARELLRKKLLGRKVSVVLDYDRNDRDYCTVFLEKQSIALWLVEAGLANVTSYDDNEKSSVYQQLTIAENRARAANKNKWNKNGAPPVYRVTDTTLRSDETEKKESKQKAKQFIGALQRAGRVAGIVEHVFNGSRLKVSIPGENVIIAFGFEAIRTPSNRDEKDTLGQEVFDFVYDKLYQRDVELIVDSIDQGGNFFGSLFFNSKNFGVTLLEMGYARVNKSSVDFTHYAHDYKEAEEAAKAKGIRIWANQPKKDEKDSEETAPTESKVRLFKVKVSEVIDGNWFYVQMTDDAATLSKIMNELNAEEHPIIPNLEVKRGTLYCAKMPDDSWYRVRVEKTEKDKVCVICVDFGNGITINKRDLRPLSPKLASAPIQAKECRLAYLQVPAVGEDYGEDAAEFFYNLVWGKDLLASVESKEGEKSLVGLGDGNELFNAVMVEAGFGIVPKSVRVNEPRKQNMVNALREKEVLARNARVGRYEYGDFRDHEEDF